MNKSRALLLKLFVVVFLGVLLVKLYRIQINEHEKFKFIANKQQHKTEKLYAERGSIFDRSGNLLVYTKNEVSFFVDNRMSKKQVSNETIAKKFALVFGNNEKHYLNILASQKGQIRLINKAPRYKAIKLKNFIVDRLYSVQDFTRIYPYGSLASQVLGFVNKQGVGVSGIEKYFNKSLAGSNGKLIAERDAAGRIVSFNENVSIMQKNGMNIELTIDKTYQKILEEELLKGLKKYGGNSAVGIIANPNNGEILALASLPNYDPQHYFLFSNNDRKDRVIMDTYEPGSTMKAIVMAALLNKGLVNENDVINTDNGRYNYKGVWILDTHSYKKLTVSQILMHSSNIGMVKLSERIDPDSFYRYLRNFGFGNDTFIDLPGEVPGKLKKPSQYSKISKAFIAHGYEISVTPIQMTAAYSALVNGGILYQPLLVKSMFDNKKEKVINFSPKKIRRVISQKTSERIRKMLIGVVEKGTGINARLNNVLVGGKTGTTQKLINGKYSKEKYYSSFIGFFPASEPKIMIYIMVDSPQKGRYGGAVAAPIFKNVAQRICKANVSLVPPSEKIKRKKVSNKQYFANLIDDNDIGTNFISTDIDKGLNISKTGKKNIQEKLTMPNLKHKSIRLAISEISFTGLKLKIKGYGKIIWQSIAPGSKIVPGEQLILKCENNY